MTNTCTNINVLDKFSIIVFQLPLDSLFACEVLYFVSQLQRGNVRAVEALLSPPDSVIFSSPESTYCLLITTIT